MSQGTAEKPGKKTDDRPEEAGEASVEEVREQARERPKKKKPAPAVEKIKKRGERISSYYRVEGTGVERLKSFCERCGPGYFMADHGDRYACGHCDGFHP
jgi:small subunit ribosomal protein S27Ae